mmetsp:Transcript_40339/g.29738  ORF Transcript_40339/g.29738 Transcript_40339/m.29738 type:complete len:251 (+) Transcript_40339:253-1005(+)
MTTTELQDTIQPMKVMTIIQLRDLLQAVALKEGKGQLLMIAITQVIKVQVVAQRTGRGMKPAAVLQKLLGLPQVVALREILQGLLLAAAQETQVSLLLAVALRETPQGHLLAVHQETILLDHPRVAAPKILLGHPQVVALKLIIMDLLLTILQETTVATSLKMTQDRQEIVLKMKQDHHPTVLRMKQDLQTTVLRMKQGHLQAVLPTLPDLQVPVLQTQPDHLLRPAALQRDHHLRPVQEPLLLQAPKGN